MTPALMRQYLATHAPGLEVVELPGAHTTEYIAREAAQFLLDFAVGDVCKEM